MRSKLLIEQHFHGCYGIDFNNASVEDILYLAHKMRAEGYGAIFPTLVTDSIDNIKKQINIIKTAAKKQTSDTAKIIGIHLEGIFINPIKKGIHNSDLFLEPTIENFNKISDDFIKIVTLAPELCKKDETENLILYLKNKGIKVQAGHCVGGDLSYCDGVTHIYNAMSAVTHRGDSTALSALVNDNIYAEIIADGVHVSDAAIKLLIKSKPEDKIILVSDSLPCTNSSLSEFVFAGEKIFYDGNSAKSHAGTLAGSTKMLPEIIKILADKNLFNPVYINNPYIYHKIDLAGEIEWDENYNIVRVL